MPAPITPTGSPATLTLAPVTRWTRAIKAARSGDDVGDQARAQALDLVLEQQLALLQALQLQPVLARLDHQAADHVVEVMVLDLQRLQALADLGFFLFGRSGVGHEVENVRWKTSGGKRRPVRQSYQ